MQYKDTGFLKQYEMSFRVCSHVAGPQHKICAEGEWCGFCCWVYHRSINPYHSPRTYLMLRTGNVWFHIVELLQKFSGRMGSHSVLGSIHSISQKTKQTKKNIKNPTILTSPSCGNTSLFPVWSTTVTLLEASSRDNIVEPEMHRHVSVVCFKLHFCLFNFF